MIEYRDAIAKRLDLDMRVHTNPDGAGKISPFSHGSQVHTDIMKTAALKQALDKYGFDAAFGGARRDEENPGPKSGCCPSAVKPTAGTRKPAPGTVESV